MSVNLPSTYLDYFTSPIESFIQVIFHNMDNDEESLPSRINDFVVGVSALGLATSTITLVGSGLKYAISAGCDMLAVALIGEAVGAGSTLALIALEVALVAAAIFAVTYAVSAAIQFYTHQEEKHDHIREHIRVDQPVDLFI